MAILSRAGNWAVVHMPGRKFPGIHVQGDTFAILRTQLAGVARRLHGEPGDPDALDDLDGVVEEIDAMLAFYEQTLSEQGFKRPY
jgi:Family of unknown function (DUF6959)